MYICGKIGFGIGVSNLHLAAVERSTIIEISLHQDLCLSEFGIFANKREMNRAIPDDRGDTMFLTCVG